MELTSKQRAQLRAMANSLDTILQIGKDGIGDNVVQQANEALEAFTEPGFAEELFETLQESLGAEEPPADEGSGDGHGPSDPGEGPTEPGGGPAPEGPEDPTA